MRALERQDIKRPILGFSWSHMTKMRLRNESEDDIALDYRTVIIIHVPSLCVDAIELGNRSKLPKMSSYQHTALAHDGGATKRETICKGDQCSTAQVIETMLRTQPWWYPYHFMEVILYR